ncbi:MAG: transposase [Rhizomicrobium sp.]
MSSHTPLPKVSRIEVISTGARRRWTLEEKQRIVAESFSAPRIVSATARRYGLSNSQLWNWRRLARSGRLSGEGDPAGFVPAVALAELPAAQPLAADASERLPDPGGVGTPASSRMIIVLCGARQVIVGSYLDRRQLQRESFDDFKANGISGIIAA